MPTKSEYQRLKEKYGKTCPVCGIAIGPISDTCTKHRPKELQGGPGNKVAKRKKNYVRKPPKPPTELSAVDGLSIPQRIHAKYGTSREMMESLWKK